MKVKSYERQAFIQGLRQLADFLEQHEVIPVPEFERSIMVFIESAEAFKTYARHMGHAHKDFVEEWIQLRKTFGPITYTLTMERAKICTKTVIGMRDVPAHQEEIVEWSCSDSILAEEPL